MIQLALLSYIFINLIEYPIPAATATPARHKNRQKPSREPSVVS